MSIIPSIFSGIGVSMLVIFLLASLILYAKAKLVAQGDIKIDINNGTKLLTVKPGLSLLGTLANQNIFLSSACGGKGTCALCKCQVYDGGGEPLPTEKPYFSRKQLQDNYRLGCQVKVKQDLKIHIPENVFGIKKWECTVTSNRSVATFIRELTLAMPAGETLKFKNGGYIQIDVPPFEMDFSKDLIIEDKYREDWDKMRIWELHAKNEEPIFRAYSMANHPAEGNKVMLNVRIATPPWDRKANFFQKDTQPGFASSYMYGLKPGDKATISGPFGEFYIQETQREMVFIGGGAGMAPMRSHIFHLFHTEKTTRKAIFFYGARSVREMFYDEEFKAIEQQFPNFRYIVGLSEPLPADNWTGPVGFIHQVTYEHYLKNHPAPEDIEYYLCGPPLMLNAIKKMLADLGVEDTMIRFDEF